VDHVLGDAPEPARGYAEFREPNIRQHEDVFDPATLGWSPSVVQYFQGTKYMPRFEISAGRACWGRTGGATPSTRSGPSSDVDKVTGAHNLRAGWDWRSYQEYGVPAAHAAGRYDFNANYTRQLDNSPNAATGQQLAAMLLGQPTGGIIAARRPLQYDQLPGVLLPGRLARQRQADAQPRPALRVRMGDHRARQPERTRLRSDGGAHDYQRGAGGVRGEPIRK